MAFVFEDDQKATAPAAGADGGRFVFEDDEPAGPVIRQGKAPSLVDRVFDLFENPDKERAKAVQALVDAEVFNIRPSDAMRYRAAIDSGVKLNKNAIAASRRTTLMDRITQSWQTGVDQVAMGMHGADVVMNNDPVAFEKMLEVQGRMPTEDTEFIPESKLEYAFRSAAKMSPMMFQIMKESVKKGLPVSMAAGGAVALLNMGPQGVSAPVTVPAAAAIGFKAGATGAAFTEALKLESGLAFSEFLMLKDDQGNQIDPNIARAAAFGVGAINAGLEVAQIKTLLKTVPGLDKLVGKAVMEAVTSKALKDRLASVATMYAGTVAKETAQELAQESTNIVMEHVAANVNNAIKGTDIKASDMEAILDRLFATGKESAAAFSVMALPGASLRRLPPRKKQAGGNVPDASPRADQGAGKGVVDAQPEKGFPVILGVNEDANGEVFGFTMADPTTGETFDVPALKAEDKDTVRYVPDMSALDTQADIDTQIDLIIEGQEDIDQISAKIFQDDIDETGFVEEAFTDADAKPETVLDRVKAINDRIGEKGSVDIGPLVELGRSIWAEGHQTIEAFTARAKELLSDVWEKVKYHIQAAWESVKAFNESLGERGSVSWKKKPTTEEINMMLSAAARQDQATGGNLAPESYLDLQAQAAQEAFAVIEKKMTRTQKREAAMLARQGEADARLMPVYSAMSHIVNAGGMSLKSLQADYDGNTIREQMNKRPGLVSNKGTMGPDVFADQHGFESGDDMINAILDWRGLKAEGKAQAEEFFKYYEKVIATDDMAAMREEFERAEQKALDRLTKKYKPKAAKGIKKEIRRRTGQVQPGDRMVTEYDALTEAFRKEANTARRAFSEGKKEEVERSKEAMRWLVKRRKSLQNVRDYFNLTDAEMMSATNRRNPALMDDAEFKQFLRNVELKAVELAETRQEKMALLKLIEEKRLKKVDNYRRALELPTFNDMTAQQLRDFAKLLEPFQEDDVFLTQRELETVDRTDLKGIKTWREARERLAQEAGVPVEELNKVHVEALDSFRWDTSLRERDPFFGILVEQMTQSYLGAQLRAHEIENRVYELARKSEKSRDRGIIGRLIPQDDLIMAYLEAPMDQKAAIVEQMTPEQIDFANYMQQYFAGALEYLIATKSIERGRENYFVHIRKTFLENLKDGGLKKAVSEIFKTYQQDQMVFNILDDDTGKILPLEKFFQFSLQRTDTMDPTRNVTKAFLTYVNTFEKKKMFDAIIPKLDIYAQALTPTRYTPRGLEIDRSLKTFVNKWINNKKGRRISFDSTLRQGGPLDVGIRALRAFTTILDLGLSPVVQTAAFIGEQVTNAAMLGNKAMAIGTARMRTAQGKAILKKYESWVGRSLWEEFTAPGKEITERLSQALFAGFHLSSVSANKQFLLASLTDQEWQSGEISTERLAEMRLDMGRFRVVPGTGSLVGSTSVGDAVMQYKKWAAPFARTLAVDAQKFLGDLKSKPIGEALTSREARELYRLAYMSMAVFVVGAMAGADDDDKSVMGKAKARMYREAMTLMQGVDPTLWLASPRLLTWLYQTASALKSVALMETYKSGDKEGELKGPDKMKRQFVPGVVRSLSNEENKR